MDHFGRRNFMRLGLSGMTGALAQPVWSQTNRRAVRREQTEVPLEYQFVLEPGTVRQASRLNLASSRINPWAIPAEFENEVPALLSPLSLSVPQVEDWIQANIRDCCSLPAAGASGNPSPLDVLMRAPLLGSLDVADIVGAASAAIADGDSIALSLEFLHPEAGSESPGSISDRSGLPMLAQSRLAAYTFFIRGFKLDISGPDTHPLGTCVTTPVKHFHITVSRREANGSFTPVANYSLGAFQQDGKRCIVLFNDVAPGVCWIICSPARQDLAKMIKLIISSAIALLGITVPSWIVALSADIAAAILFTPILLLA